MQRHTVREVNRKCFYITREWDIKVEMSLNMSKSVAKLMGIKFQKDAIQE